MEPVEDNYVVDRWCGEAALKLRDASKSQTTIFGHGKLGLQSATKVGVKHFVLRALPADMQLQ
jgi:hypothetical protein